MGNLICFTDREPTSASAAATTAVEPCEQRQQHASPVSTRSVAAPAEQKRTVRHASVTTQKSPSFSVTIQPRGLRSTASSLLHVAESSAASADDSRDSADEQILVYVAFGDRWVGMRVSTSATVRDMVCMAIRTARDSLPGRTRNELVPAEIDECQALWIKGPRARGAHRLSTDIHGLEVRACGIGERDTIVLCRANQEPPLSPSAIVPIVDL